MSDVRVDHSFLVRSAVRPARSCMAVQGGPIGVQYRALRLYDCSEQRYGPLVPQYISILNEPVDLTQCE